MSHNPSILVIYNEAAFALEEDGAQARVAEMLDCACENFDHITVYSYQNHHRYPWGNKEIQAFKRRWPRVRLVLDTYGPLLKWSAAAKNLLISLFPSRAPALLRMAVPFSAPAYRTIAHADAVYMINHKFGLTQLNGVDPDRCFVDTHDLLWLKAARLGNEPTTSIGILRKLRGEVAALNAVRGVIAISPVETSFFKMVLSNVAIFYVPLWEKLRDAAKASSGPFEFDLVFVASDYTMNVRGFCKMLETHGHWLANYRIAVCGNICSDPEIVAATSNYANIALLGFIEDLESVYRTSKAAIAPVEGTGLKIKIVSALEAGLPAFASEQAIEGLPPGYEKAVFPIDQRAVRRVLDDQAALQNAKSAASEYYRLFNAAGDSGKVVDAFKALMGNRPSEEPSRLRVKEEIAL